MKKPKNTNSDFLNETKICAEETLILAPLAIQTKAAWLKKKFKKLDLSNRIWLNFEKKNMPRQKNVKLAPKKNLPRDNKTENASAAFS